MANRPETVLQVSTTSGAGQGYRVGRIREHQRTALLDSWLKNKPIFRSRQNRELLKYAPKNTLNN